MPRVPEPGRGAGSERPRSTPPPDPRGSRRGSLPLSRTRRSTVTQNVASQSVRQQNSAAPDIAAANPAFLDTTSQNTESGIRPLGKGRPESLRALATAGLLAQTAADPGAARSALESEAYALVWPIVFNRFTKELEFKRGHRLCARSVHGLAPECLDRFHDDVAAVIDYLLRYANVPIRELEPWIASRLAAATVDGHRRERGRRGAAQRPRVPKWLVDRLDGDSWLVELALSVLTWVGVPAAVGGGLWPLDAWRLRRAEALGDWTGEPGAIERDVESVLAAMRTRSAWFLKFVERPLGAKQAPVYSGQPPGGQGSGSVPALVLVDEHESDESRLTLLAGLAVDELTRRLAAGEEPRTCVTDIVRRVFAEADPAAELDRAPHAGPDYQERAGALLSDPAEIDRIVAAVIEIVSPCAAPVTPVAPAA